MINLLNWTHEIRPNRTILNSYSPACKQRGLSSNTLGQPDVVGEPPFFYPLSAWTLPTQNHLITPTPPPTPFIPKPKKKWKYREKCPKCRRKYLYDHVTWARGYDSGYTCQCPKEPSPTQATSSRAPLTNIHPYNTNPAGFVGPTQHTQEFTLSINAPIVTFTHQNTCLRVANNNLGNPGVYHRLKKNWGPQHLSTGTTSYYEIEGYEDRNLNGENWPSDSYGPKPIFTLESLTWSDSISFI